MLEKLSYLSVFIPLLGAAVAHGPFLKWDWWPGLKRPLDGGATFRGKRVFGDNKTWRGAIVIWIGVFASAVGLHYWPAYREWFPAEIQAANPFVFGALLGLGVVCGELPNSFMKRQLGVAPGTRKAGEALGVVLSLLDQGDFVFGIWFFLLPLWVMRPWQAAVAFTGVTAVHMLVNVIGYAIGARKTLI